MARYTGPREKIERRLKTKLFLKGERSFSPKSATVKRMYPPGQHGKAFSRRPSEFGLQLQAKQRVRNTYRMLEKQFKNWAKEAIKSSDESSSMIISRLERRLDNFLYRAGFAQSRDQARQVVNHGHILVNGRRASIPSYEVRLNDVIKVREGSAKSKYFTLMLPQWIKNHKPPRWIEVNAGALTAKVSGLPTIDESGLDIKDIRSIIEYYSR